MPTHHKKPVFKKREPPFDLALFIGLGYALLVGVVGIVFSLDPAGFKNMWQIPHYPDAALTICQIALFVVLAVFTISWLQATVHELKLWLDWTDVRSTPKETIWAIIAIAIYLGLSLAFVHRVVVITVFSSIGFLVNYLTQALCKKIFRGAVDETKNRAVPDSMIHYWLELPHGLRVLLMFLLSCVASAFAIEGYLRGGDRELYVVAYLILIVDILTAEIVITIWRRKRDHGIAKLQGGAQ